MEGNAIGIKAIIDRIKRHKMLSTLDEEYIIDMSVEFINIMGIPETYSEKYATIDIENYCGKLPDDCLEVLGVRKLPTEELPAGAVYVPIYYRYATGTFHTSDNKYNHEPYVYKVQRSLLYTSTKVGKVEIKYRALETDDCGFPMIPDDSSFLRALESYIKVRHFTDLFDEGHLAAPILNNAQQDYAWNVAGLSTAMRKLTPDKVKSITNIVKSQLIRDEEHLTGYAHLGRNTKTVIH